LPYIMVLKQLLYEYKYSENEIKRFLRKEKKLPDNMKAISDEIDFILKSDPTSSINSIDKKNSATEFENTIAEFLDKRGIKYISENETRKDKELNTTLTPDFLLKRDQFVYINGFPINWIEVKNYTYYGNKLLEKGIQRQATRYYNKYGNGIFIFRYGAISIENLGILGILGTPGVKIIGWK